MKIIIFPKVYYRKKEKRGDLIEGLIGCLCLSVLIMTMFRVNAWISTKRAETQANSYMTVHNVDVMERLKEQVKLTGLPLVEFYGNDEFSTFDIITTVKCKEIGVQSMQMYRIHIYSKMNGTPYSLANDYIMTILPGESGSISTDPVVNPE